MIIHEAIDTMFTLGWALIVWIAVFAAIGTGLLLATAAAICWTARAVWRRIRRPKPARDDYEEAA